MARWLGLDWFDGAIRFERGCRNCASACYCLLVCKCMISKKLQVEPIGRRLECPTVLDELDDNLTNRRPDFQEFKKFIEKREPNTRFRVCKDRLGSTDRSISTELPQSNLRKLAHATGYQESFENVSWWCSSVGQHFDDDPYWDVWLAGAERSW